MFMQRSCQRLATVDWQVSLLSPLLPAAAAAQQPQPKTTQSPPILFLPTRRCCSSPMKNALSLLAAAMADGCWLLEKKKDGARRQRLVVAKLQRLEAASSATGRTSKVRVHPSEMMPRSHKTQLCTSRSWSKSNCCWSMAMPVRHHVRHVIASTCRTHTCALVVVEVIRILDMIHFRFLPTARHGLGDGSGKLESWART